MTRAKNRLTAVNAWGTVIILEIDSEGSVVNSMPVPGCAVGGLIRILQELESDASMDFAVARNLYGRFSRDNPSAAMREVNNEAQTRDPAP